MIEQLFSLIWQSGDDVSSPEFWEKTCHSIGVDAKDLSFNEEPIKNKLLENTNFAIGKGVFGVPTLLIEDTLFWGLDATQFALEFQKNPLLFQREEYQKLSQVQIGAKRI